jgi:hypothetical protein
MPNWCNNTITIEHKDSSKIHEVIESLTTKIHEDTSESKFFTYCKPEPDYSKTKVKYTYPSITKKEYIEVDDQKWWDWRIQNWGTKWNIDTFEKRELFDNPTDIEVSDLDRSISFSCETAWSPPLGALKSLEKKGFKVSCDYYEGGVAFVGRYTTNKGDIDWQLPTTFTDLKDMMKKNKMFEDIVEYWGIDLDYEEMEREEEE